MIQFGNKHGWNSIKCRTTLLMNRSQCYQSIKFFNHYLRATMCQAIHYCQNNTKTVKKRDTDAKLVILSKFHVFSRVKTVVGYVVMRKHNSFRKTGGAGSILHIDHVVTIDRFFQLKIFFVILITSK